MGLVRVGVFRGFIGKSVKPVNKLRFSSKHPHKPYAKLRISSKPPKPCFIKNSKNRDFRVLRHKRIIFKIQSAATFRVFDVFDVLTRIKPEWVGVLTKMTSFDTVYDTNVGNHF